MNMSIIEIMNLYITRGNQEWLHEQLDAGNSMSGIINRLIEKERGLTALDVAKAAFTEALSEDTGTDIRFVDDKRLGPGGKD